MNRTSIEWTDFSANPLKFHDRDGKVVWGCVHASPGCQHCYAETLAKRYGRGGPFNVPTMNGLTPFLDEKELHRMLTYKPASGKRCFVGDMTDVFGEWVPDDLLDRLFAAFSLRSDVTWQVLTKRAERMRQYIDSRGGRLSFNVRLQAILLNADNEVSTPEHTWPLPNVWLGVSCEDQQRADERIAPLLRTPAAVRFVSAEPLLGPVTLHALPGGPGRWQEKPGDIRSLDWVIVGGESGPKSRPCNVEWVRSLIAQCQRAGVACFVKQLGSDNVSALGFGPLDGVTSYKGNVMGEWPDDLRVREFPQQAVPA